MSHSESAPLSVRLKGLLHRRKSNGPYGIEDDSENGDLDPSHRNARELPSRSGADALGYDVQTSPLTSNEPPTPPPKDRNTLRKVRKSDGTEPDSAPFDALPVKQLSFGDSICESELRRDLARTSIEQESSEMFNSI